MSGHEKRYRSEEIAPEPTTFLHRTLWWIWSSWSKTLKLCASLAQVLGCTGYKVGRKPHDWLSFSFDKFWKPPPRCRITHFLESAQMLKIYKWIHDKLAITWFTLSPMPNCSTSIWKSHKYLSKIFPCTRCSGNSGFLSRALQLVIWYDMGFGRRFFLKGNQQIICC